jgi:hypothetical protein
MYLDNEEQHIKIELKSKIIKIFIDKFYKCQQQVRNKKPKEQMILRSRQDRFLIKFARKLNIISIRTSRAQSLMEARSKSMKKI